MATTPKPRQTIAVDGCARLYRMGRARPSEARSKAPPVLLVPSLINRWYVLDLREGHSVAAALLDAGLDVWCLDWGAPEEEDRYLSWDEVLTRLARACRRVRRATGHRRTSVVGYCMGATLSGIHAALEPETIAGFVNLLGPFDFQQGGALSRMTDPRWFDAEAVAEVGNVDAQQMQSAFALLRPTAALAKWVSFAEKASDPAFREGFFALEKWASDNVSFPAAAYRTYIAELYQKNSLIRGQHTARGRSVDLKAISCPVLTVIAEKDAICPPQAAEALTGAVGSRDATVLRIPGGHVGAVIGPKASKVLYPHLATWLSEKPCNSIN